MNLLAVMLLFSVLLVFCITSSTCAIEQKKSVSKRAFPLIFERGAATTILVALAIPADLENENVYVAINYAANYANPQAATHLTQPLNRFKKKNKRSVEGEYETPSNNITTEEQDTNEGISEDHQAQLISRTSFYKFFINKLNGFYGGHGKVCLLRTICEINSTPVHENNGVLGNFLQVMFSPSLSNREYKFPEIFYEAESKGQNGNCMDYKVACPHNVLDLISHVTET